MLELDENTGLRDYDVSYTLTGNGDAVTIDPYYGKKIAGGYYVSGEASYIEYIGDLISVDSVFGVESRPDPLAEYTALAEKLQRECNEVFYNNDIDFNF